MVMWFVLNVDHVCSSYHFLKPAIVVLNIISYSGHFSGIVLWPSTIVYVLGVVGFWC
jgi:hypothetical protein